LVLSTATFEAQVDDNLLEALGWGLVGAELTTGRRVMILLVFLLFESLVRVL